MSDFPLPPSSAFQLSAVHTMYLPSEDQYAWKLSWNSASRVRRVRRLPSRRITQMSDPMPPKPGDPILTAWPLHEWNRIHCPWGCTTGTWFGPSSPQVRQALSAPSSVER
jgi:hypothetical protein